MLLVVLLLLVSSASAAGVPIETCIIGAGSGGLQLGNLLHKAGRSYQIFERNDVAGSWWKRYPVHRRLISVNSVVTGSDDPEFNMRHDWNSLLEQDEVPKVTSRTHDKWPLADVVHEYLVDYARAQEKDGRIRYNTTIAQVSRTEGPLGSLYSLDTDAGERILCTDVVVATGLPIPKKMKVGEQLVYGYEDLPPAEDFNGLRVGVLGNGNAAFETVEWLGNHASVTLMHRARLLDWNSTKTDEPAEGTRFAMMTHYVGDVRAGRLAIFDAYHLKMVDRLIRYGPDDTIVVIRCRTDKVCVSVVEKGLGKLPKINFEIDVSLQPDAERAIADFLAQHPEIGGDRLPVVNIHKVTKEGGEELFDQLARYNIDYSRFEGTRAVVIVPLELLHIKFGFLEFIQTRMAEAMTAAAAAGDASVGQIDDVFSLESAGPMLRVFDRVIRCYGWKMDRSIFDEDVKPRTAHRGKFPKIDDYYRDPNSGIYFAGALAHSLDFRLSAGGFIHGFRYSARALFRYLEEARHAVPWPNQSFNLDEARADRSSGRQGLLRKLVYRMDNGAGPYQMFGGTLLEGIVLTNETESSELVATYYEEMPPAHFHERFKDSVRIVWYFEYGHSIEGAEWLYASNVGATAPELAQNSTFLHPHLKIYAGDGLAKDAVVLGEHFVLEDINLFFRKQNSHILPLVRFLELAFDMAKGRCRADD